MLLTLNQVISQITTLAAAHSQIAASGVGDFAEWQAEERNYPLLWVFHETTNVGNRELVYSIRLICADRVITGEEGEDTDGMEQEVLSDTLLILLDFLAYFQQQHSQTYTVIPSATIDPFTERFNDRVAGNSMVIQIRQPFTWDACQIPQSGATIPPTVDGLTLYDFCDPSVIARLTAEQVACLEAEYALPCADVTQRVNGTTIGTTASGGINNQLIRNTAGTAVGTSANPSVIANTTLRNSATPTWTDSVVSGVTKTLAQGKALDSDGATTLLANYIPTTDGFMFTCTPSPPCADATIEINGTAFGTVASGGTLDIPVINGGSNAVGSLQGSDWVIGNNATFINSVQVTDQEAEVDANIAVELDGNPSGSWNAGTQTWEVTSSPCADATVTINGASLGATGDIPSGGFEDLDVLQGGSPVGSWNGSAWIIPACPASGSLSIALSDSTPNFGDAVTITVTPTGITPTSYTFIVSKDDGDYLRVTQVSNVYVWAAVYTGTQTISVVATDGANVVANEASVTVTWAFNQAINFNGTTQYITAVQEGAFGVASASKWMLSFWINVDSLTNNPIVFSYNNFWFIQIRATDVRMRFDTSGSGKTYAQTFVAAQWYHVVVQRTGVGDNVSVYVNAVQRTTTVGTVGTDVVSTELLQIGRYAGGAGFEFDGKLDSVFFQRGYNATLAQIQAYYNGGAGAHPSVLGFTYADSNLYLDGNTTNSGVSPYTFTAVNSPSYVAH